MPALAQTPSRAVPNAQQLEWHEMEYYWFIHFGPNTFTDKEWGHGDEPEDVFNPTQLDCRQWARIAKQSGAKGIIITAKHHDGFCLWPSEYSTHTVRESKWKDGKGDVLKELSAACKEYGLKFGVYLSPWDRNHPKYGTDEYNDVYVNTMKELIKRYGPFFEFWWDGANGEGPNGKKQEYDFKRFENVMRKEAPRTLVFSDIGPDIRWVGNEKGIAGKTNWNYLDTGGFKRGLGAPPNDTLSQGNLYGKNWIPAECDVSIRPGWFYHPEEDSKVKTGKQLFELYLKSVGRGANLLLNIPPDRNGLIHSADSAALMKFKELRESGFSDKALIRNYYFIDNGTVSFSGTQDRITISDFRGTGKIIDIQFETPQLINCLVLKEDLRNGQACKRFNITFFNDKQEAVYQINETTIGRKRILSFPRRTIGKISLSIIDQSFPTKLLEIQPYLIPENLVEK